MPNDYLTVANLKASMPDTSWGSAYDTAMGTAITDASRAIDEFTHREPGAYYVTADTTRWFNGDGSQELWIGELAAAPTSLSVAEDGVVDGSAGTGGTYTTWAATDYLLWPPNALLRGKPYLMIAIDINNGTKAYFYQYPKSVKIVGKFGYSATIPSIINRATIVQATRYFKRAQQAQRDTGAVVELGQLQYTQKLDPDVALLVEHLIPRVPLEE